jgi:amidohydrolase
MPAVMKDRIRKHAVEIFQELIGIRRHLHANPELSYQEEKTAAFIQETLRNYGIPFTSGVGGHGIVGLIEGGKPGKMIALRADMDALPITEVNEVPYKSINSGVMHACGHDVHMTCLLGAAKILQEIREDLSGSVRLIFQPAEESFPGGASLMIKDGVLENPVPAAILGQHTLPTLEAGKVGMKSGMYMASTDEIYLTVKGKGGHAATPELLIDPVVAAAQIIVALQQVVSRKANPATPTLLSFGKIIGDGRTNIIPDTVTIAGTLRTFDEVWRKQAHHHITTIAQNTAHAFGASCEVNIHAGYPFVVNDESLTTRTFNHAAEFLGSENVVPLEMRMTAEDFAYYSQIIPGCFYRLGVRNESRGITSNLHTPTFDADERSLEIGAGLMAWLAFTELES